MGVVANAINQPLEDAYISLNEGEYTVIQIVAVFTALTHLWGFTGDASSPGYITQTIENVEIDPNQTTHLHFVMVSETDIDDNEIPSLSPLHPNYPTLQSRNYHQLQHQGCGAVRLISAISGQLVTTLVNEGGPAATIKPSGMAEMPAAELAARDLLLSAGSRIP